MSGIFTFACGDRNVCDQGVQFVGGVLVLITLPGQPYAYPVRHVPATHTLWLLSINPSYLIFGWRGYIDQQMYHESNYM